ncbi:MAG TPA: hypothetical protein VMF64_17160 [Steroidobacteraceae bacterium]|nr:hypothetical protein [Steroidobacteraceae bacterium]
MHTATPVSRTVLCALVSAAGLAGCAASPPGRQNGPAFDAVWQHHQTTINYFGLTALYTCDGLQEQVRSILLYLGARPDLKVQQVGCDRGANSPGHLASVQADFYTLAPAPDTAAGTVSAEWAPVTIKPMNPVWIGYGECELLQQIKPVVTGDYSARDLHYHTACVPYDAGIADFDLDGEFPKTTASR